MFVRHWMTSPVVAIETTASILDGLRLMEMRRIRRLPVFSGEGLAGIVTREDLHAFLGYGDGVSGEVERPIERAMRSPVRTAAPDDTLERAAELMLEHEISGLPVFSGERVVGMITESDVFRAFTRLMGIREPGARVTMSVPDGSDLVDEVVKRAGGLAIRSLAASPAAGGGWDVVMRVRGRSAAPSASPR